jgi:hypothetical protein
MHWHSQSAPSPVDVNAAARPPKTNHKLDLKVSEARLAALVGHAISYAAVGADELSFRLFAAFSNDLAGFIEEHTSSVGFLGCGVS